MAQWAVVRRRIPASGLWAPLTIGGWSLTGVTIGVITGALGGGPATAQWLLLRRNSQTWGSYAIRYFLGLAVGGLAGWVTGTA